MNHLSLFSGIGGFDLAAEWMGWENIAMVEKDKFCQRVLKKNFPKTKIHDDIFTFPAADYFGRIDIITGGFPCQPFSQAGSRKGTNDDRHLWPEMLRVIRTIKPTWVIAENVRGLLTIEQGVVFEQVCLDLEAAGYEVQPFIIPASAVNAPHKRERVWFLAHAIGNQYRGRSRSLREKEGLSSLSGEAVESGGTCGTDQDVANIKREGRGERPVSKTRPDARRDFKRNWLEVAAEFCSVDDGVSVELDGFKLTKARNRAEQLKAYGNAIVPQIAFEIFKSLNI
jgi:DNA (cytosine-5)-methyltransferase 1